MKMHPSPGPSALFKAFCAWALLGLIATPSLRAQNTPLNDSNFNTARDLWFSDQAAATATYGHIKDWNVTGVTNMSNAFKDRATFNEDISGWDVSNVTGMSSMFKGASAFNQPIGGWNVSKVEWIGNMFEGASSFNQPIGNWDVSSALTLHSTFKGASAFNQPIGDWNVSKVKWMTDAFNGASSFDQPIGNWNVSSAHTLHSTFKNASSFNQPIGDWNVSSVTDMNQTFLGASSFNQPIGNWDVSAVTKMHGLFTHASSFNQPIGNWDVSAVQYMYYMFGSASSFNQPIGDWNTSAVTNMNGMFSNATSFNQPIGNWDVSAVTWMSYMFANNSAFNQDIGGWNTLAVTKMNGMFSSASSFNQPIGNWDVSSVSEMKWTFLSATAFNQDIGDWNISAVTGMDGMFYGNPVLSNSNKGLIHASFSSNSNWPYDWSAQVPAPATLTNANFQTAVDLWCTDRATAFTTYGHIKDWNVTGVTDMTQAFKDRATFNDDISGWDVSNVTTMRDMFNGATAFNQPIGNWNVSKVTNLLRAFTAASSFNQPIGNWDVSQVVHMYHTFQAASSFNQPIGDWNVSSVTDMHGMFNTASSFNQDVSGWDTSAVTDMGHLFYLAAKFDQNLSDWNVSAATDMTNIFLDASALSYANKRKIHDSFSSNSNWPYDWSVQGLGSPAFTNANFQTAVNLWCTDQSSAISTYGHIKDWNVTGVTNMEEAFKDRSTFNDDISGWDVSNVTTMSYMFKGASAFNQPIGNWNTSAVLNMAAMFQNASAFNQPIGNWNTSEVTNMGFMFKNAGSFNQAISNWNTDKVISFIQIFNDATYFNQPIGNWNTSLVTDMGSVFNGATSFNQDVSDWNTSAVMNMANIFLDTPALSDVNKGLIHGSFSSNSNWPYDWSVHFTRPAHVVPSAANLRMLWVEPGSFIMGSPVTESGRGTNEVEHTVTFSKGFYLGKYEVTQAQYEALMTNNANGLSPTPSNWPNNPDRPVEQVSWDDIQVFLTRLNATEQAAGRLPVGWSYVLPTESEWEYACRAGTTTIYSWGNDINASRANYDQSGLAQTRDVGQYAANPWGFHDMHGNVWEWTNDSYGAYPSGPVTDPAGPGPSTGRVRRGGSWNDAGVVLRSARRYNIGASGRSTALGFRLAYRQTTPPPAITDANFQTAVNLWFSDQSSAISTYGFIKDWNVTGVTNMNEAFKDRTTFNEDISGWDVSNVTDMTRMFSGASSFNQPIGGWNVSSVKWMGYMFHNTAFNQPIGSWNVSSLVSMTGMFDRASSFNQPIGNWNTSTVTDMRWTFFKATAFNQPVGTWNVSKVTGMTGMFSGATAFNQPIGNWNVSAVTDTKWMFSQASVFNQPIGNWNVSAVTDMKWMFNNATAFNQDVSKWNVSAVTNMLDMFKYTPALSDPNKGLIHGSFSPNPHWPYDWSAHVSQLPPLPKALAVQDLGNSQYTFWGIIQADGGSPVTGVAFEVADNMVFRNSSLHTATILAGTTNFSTTATLQPGKRYYYRAVATNAAGSNNSAAKQFTTSAGQTHWWSDSVETAGGWRTSTWFGTFRPYENGWIYHTKLGWAYAHPDGSGGLWLWLKDHHWMWTQSGVYPYFWKHNIGTWHYLIGLNNGRPYFIEWVDNKPKQSKTLPNSVKTTGSFLNPLDGMFVDEFEPKGKIYFPDLSNEPTDEVYNFRTPSGRTGRIMLNRKFLEQRIIYVDPSGKSWEADLNKPGYEKTFSPLSRSVTPSSAQSKTLPNSVKTTRFFLTPVDGFSLSGFDQKGKIYFPNLSNESNDEVYNFRTPSGMTGMIMLNGKKFIEPRIIYVDPSGKSWEADLNGPEYEKTFKALP